jgi:regulatory protein
MKITGLTSQQRDKNRINVMVDGKYRFSLDLTQVIDLGIKIGKEYTDEELTSLEVESQYGKTYMRALEYCLMRPHSSKEVRDYLYKKTRDTRTKTGEIKKGIASEITARVYERLVEKGYINDEKFARYWIENRNVKKGVSKRKLQAELRTKGVDVALVERLLTESVRSDGDELRKVIEKKRRRYTDDQKFMHYLARQGFAYDDIKRALEDQS